MILPPVSTKVIVPSGMLGSGFPAESVRRGIELGANAIAIDAGSTDSGPYYLGAGVSKSAAAAIKRDLRVLLAASRESEIPLVVGSCATSGTDAGVDWVTNIAEEIAAEDGLSFRLARIYSEQSQDVLASRLADGRIRRIDAPWIITDNTHGTGCTLSAAIAAYLASGHPIEVAVRGAKSYLTTALSHGRDLRVGAGAGPVDHLLAAPPP